MEHRVWCREELDRSRIEREAWSQAHPGYCRTCEGRAEIGSGEMDPDTGYVDLDPCPACIETGLCPWCGQALVLHDANNPNRVHEACPDSACGWESLLNEGEGMPWLAECECRLETMMVPGD